MRNLLKVTGAALLATAMTAGASEGVYLGGSLSGYLLDDKRTVDSDSAESLVGGLNLGYRVDRWAVETGIGTDLAGEDLDLAKADLYYYLGNTDESWVPYIVAGVSYFERDEDNLERGEGYTWQAAAGVGLSNMIDDHWEFRGDARLVQKILNGRDNTTDLALTLGVNYYFNPPAPAPAPAPEPAPAAEVAPETRTITVRLNVEFEFDKAVVRAIYGDELRAVAEAMKAHSDIDLVLEGHTDSVGTEAYNQGLSERRAAAVKERITQDYGIPANRISTVGYGESRPIADNSTADGRARNRRVIGELNYTEVVGD